MESLSNFIKEKGIKAQAQWTDRNPQMDDAQMDNWKVTLTHDHRRMTVPFSMGFGHNGREPSAEDVLDALASDSAGYENAGDFEEWCAEYGYDTDSRRAERTYKNVTRQAIALRRFLGDEAYEQLLWETERL